MRNIALELLDEPLFPIREQFGDIPFDELVASIRVKGVLEPLLVRPFAGRYQVMAGHRRMKAAQVCALSEVPCVVKECSEWEAVQTTIHENTGREDVTATEEGRFYLELVERFQLTEQQLVELVRKSPGYINERIDLVRSDVEVADAVRDHKVVYSVARELLRVNRHTAALVHHRDPLTYTEEEVQAFRRHRLFLLDLCVRSGATARVAHGYVDQWKASLVPIQPFAQPGAGTEAPLPAAARPERCVLCGRDGDPQNFLRIPIHYWERDGVLKILRSAGLEVYD
jgi:ParB/RepB/Spo0J family partition protein